MIIDFRKNGSGGGGTGSVVNWRQDLSAGTQIAAITINGHSTDVYAPEGGESGSTVAWSQDVTGGTKIAEITIDGVSTDVYAPEGGGSESESLPMVDELPESAENGEIFNLKGHYGVLAASWDRYSGSSASFKLSIFDNFNSGIEIAKWEWHGDNVFLYTYEDGGLEAKYYNATTEETTQLGIAEKGVDSGFTFISGSYRNKINIKWNTTGSQITFTYAINMVEAHDAIALYEKSILCRYNDNAGYWGKWSWNKKIDGYYINFKSSYNLNYSKFPEELDGETLISLSYFNYETENDRKNFVLNLSGNTIDVYDYATEAFERSINIGDQKVMIKFRNEAIYAYFDDGCFSIVSDSEYVEVRDIISEYTESAHYELVDRENVPVKVQENYGYYYFPAWDENGKIIGKSSSQISNSSSNINGSYYGILKFGTTNIPSMYVPTTGGTQGQILQSSGDAAPTWVNKNTITNGISFMTLTQEEYDDILVKDPMTLYIIHEDDE